jgi:hypothetical protein
MSLAIPIPNGEDLNRSTLSVTFQNFNSARVEEMYINAMKDALATSSTEVENVLQSAEMFIPSGAHRLRVLASKTLLLRASEKLGDTSPFIRIPVDEGTFVERIRRTIIRPPKSGDLIEQSLRSLVDVIMIVARVDMKDILKEYERLHRKDVQATPRSNPTALVYVPEFHMLCQYLWYTNLKLGMQQLMASVNPFQTIYRPRTETDDKEPSTPRQRETQLYTMAQYAVELLAFTDIHNKITLQGSLLTIMGLMKDYNNVANIIKRIEENDIVISLRRRLGQLKEKTKHIPEEEIVKPESQYWTFVHTITEVLTTEKMTSILTKDTIGAVGNEKFGIVAKTLRRMSLRKRPMLLTPTTPATPINVNEMLSTSPSEKKGRSFIKKMPSLKAFISMTKMKHPTSSTPRVTSPTQAKEEFTDLDGIVLDVVGVDDEGEIDQSTKDEHSNDHHSEDEPPVPILISPVPITTTPVAQPPIVEKPPKPTPVAIASPRNDTDMVEISLAASPRGRTLKSKLVEAFKSKTPSSRTPSPVEDTTSPSKPKKNAAATRYDLSRYTNIDRMISYFLDRPKKSSPKETPVICKCITQP